MGRNHKSQLQKELDNRNENKKQSLMQMFLSDDTQFEIYDDLQIEKLARQHIKETVKCNRIIRKDNMKYYNALTIPDFPFVIQFTESEEKNIVYFSIRKIK